MQTALTVEAVSKAPRQFNQQTIWGIRYQGNWYNLYTPNKPVVGSYLVCDVIETRGAPKPDGSYPIYRDARPIPQQQQLPQGNSQPQPQPQPALSQPSPSQPAPTYQPPSKPTVTAILSVIQRVLAALPQEWKQDVQHARAYAQIVNTVVMAVTDGKVQIDNADEVSDGPDAEPEPWER